MVTIEPPTDLWKSPVSPKSVSLGLRFTDVQWDVETERIVWLEIREGRGVLVCQSLDGEALRDLNDDLSVRAGVGYGGGDFVVHCGQAFFVSGGRLWRQPLRCGSPRAISPPWGEAASPAASPDGRWIAYVHTHADIDTLAVVDSQGSSWPAKLAEGRDFFMQPVWHPSGRQLAWIAWDHPNMPWDGTALFLADVDASAGLPRLSGQRTVAGDPKGDVQISQPAFSPDGRWLSYLSDRSGWLCPWLMDLENGRSRPLLEEEAEYGGPAWIQGLRFHAWSGDSASLWLIRNHEGASSLVHFDLQAERGRTVEGPLSAYSSLGQPAPGPGGQVAIIGSSPAIPQRILKLDPSGVKVLRRSQSECLPADCLSLPASLRIEVSESDPDLPDACHGLYYPPCNPAYRQPAAPALIISIHGGPTGQSVANYNAETQFFTSRGFAVLALNFRGSSGYGRHYAQALRGRWGELDVEDLVAAAESLSRQGLADPERIVLSGGSSGGLAVLLGLARFPGRFKAGICRYGVTNLFDLAAETHKFEARYLDGLVGPLPQASELYRSRSPQTLADRITDPVAIFQGEIDKVVPRAQSDAIAESLQRRGVPHVYEVYAGEGHGFRNPQTIESYYASVEDFLRRYVLFAA